MTWTGRLIIIFSFLTLTFSCRNGVDESPSSSQSGLIPKVQEKLPSSGFFLLSGSSIYSSEPELENEIKDFLNFAEDFNIDIDLVDHSLAEQQIKLVLSQENFGNEGYSLIVSEEGVDLISDTKVGIYRGLTTLKQLTLLNEFKGNYFIPCGEYNDHALFQHRGFLFDCSRHFFSKEVVKKYIDLLSFYKMNVLHWHITEDQGWRMAIDKYPRLTEVGAWRTEKDGSRYGGFYSKEDIKELVNYALEKHVTIIPEIELPGHSVAAIASYPFLSCTGDSIAVENEWGVFKEIYCAGNDSVFTFLEDVLMEVMELFPSHYIHIGGDEAPKSRWEECPKCQQRIKDEKLKDEHELQSYFIKRIQAFLNKNGREIIGWDEILEGGLAQGAVVQSWRGMEGGMEAVKQGNPSIMSPTSHAYLDYDLKTIDLEKVYSFYPLPAGLSEVEANLILGGEGNMWTEHVPDESVLDSKVFPRLLAMSEVLWSDSSGRDYPGFLERVYAQYPILDSLKVNYGLESLPFAYVVSTGDSVIEVEMHPKINNIEMLYSLNDAPAKNYEAPFFFEERKTSTLKGFAKRNNKIVGDSIVIFLRPHLALNKEIEYSSSEYSSSYSGGGKRALLDGVLGSLDFRDGHWQGFLGSDLQCIIDLAEIRKDISGIETHFYQYTNAWIMAPKEVDVQVSENGRVWTDWLKIQSEVDPKEGGQFISTFKAEGEQIKMRYLKVKVKNFGALPEWHDAAGSPAWIFIDEIIVK